MKTPKIFLFVLLVLPFFSCKNGTNQDRLTMSVEQLNDEFLKNQNRIKLITYDVVRIDTFVQGDVWRQGTKNTNNGANL
jgi:hypothetical protein